MCEMRTILRDALIKNCLQVEIKIYKLCSLLSNNKSYQSVFCDLEAYLSVTFKQCDIKLKDSFNSPWW